MSVSPAAADKPVRGVLPWLVAAALFMENLDATVLNTAVPTMAADLEVPRVPRQTVRTDQTALRSTTARSGECPAPRRMLHGGCSDAPPSRARASCT